MKYGSACDLSYIGNSLDLALCNITMVYCQVSSLRSVARFAIQF